MAERREDLRAADVDRQFVADRLKAALDEGRLSLNEYDDRLRDAYAAQTYGDLDRLLGDLPGLARAQVVPSAPASPESRKPPTAPQPPKHRGFPTWILAAWSGWLSVSIVVNVIWLLTGAGGDYWPKWVMGPWGAVLLAGTINGLVFGNGHQGKWDSKAARRRARNARRRTRRGW